MTWHVHCIIWLFISQLGAFIHCNATESIPERWTGGIDIERLLDIQRCSNDGGFPHRVFTNREMNSQMIR
jgi:hypothetical protein